MECQRCHGLMVSHELGDSDGLHATPTVASWRCVSCGEIIDPVIVKHRLPSQRHVRWFVPAARVVRVQPSTRSARLRLVR